MAREKKVNWKRGWKVGERKRVPGFDGIDAYRTKKYMPNGEPVMSFRFHVEGQKPVAVGKTSEGITLEDVAQLRSDYIKKMRFGDALPDYSRTRKGPPTLQEGWDQFIAYHKEVCPKSARGYSSTWNKRIKPRFAGMLMSEINYDMIQQWMVTLHTKKGYSPGTVNQTRNVMSRIFKYMSTTGKYQGANPAELTKRLKEDGRIRYLTKEEIGEWLQYVHDNANPQVALQINLMLLMGLRKSEVRGFKYENPTYGIRWENIDWERDTITFLRKGNEWHTMVMPQRIKGMLLAYGPKEKGFVFESYSQTPIKDLISTFGFNRGMAQGGESALKVTPHTFRHTYCTWMGKASGNMVVTQQLMNHKDSKTTARYTHEIPDDIREAMGKYEGFIHQLLNPPHAQVIPMTL